MNCNLPTSYHIIDSQVVEPKTYLSEIKTELDRIESQIDEYQPKARLTLMGRKITVVRANGVNKHVTAQAAQAIQALKELQSSISKQENKLVGFRGFEGKEIGLLKTQIQGLELKVKEYLEEHQSILQSQSKFS